MRQTISIKMVRDVSKVFVCFLVGILVALGLENPLAVLEAASKDDLRAGLGHGIVGQRTHALVARLEVVSIRRFPFERKTAVLRGACPDRVIRVEFVKVALQIVLSFDFDGDAAFPAEGTLEGVLLLVPPRTADAAQVRALRSGCGPADDLATYRAC